MTRKELEAQVNSILMPVASPDWLVERVCDFVELYARQQNGAKPIVSGSLPLSEAQITELAHIGSNYVYEGVMEDGRISELGILEVIKKYEEFKRQ